MNINLPESHVVTKGPRDKSWSASVTIDLSKLSADMIARLAVHGLHQKVADAASASKSEDEALGAMNKAVDAVLAGEWTSRTAGEGVDERTRVARIIVRKAFKDANAANSAARLAFKALDVDEQNAKLDEWFEANEAFGPMVDAELAERAAKADKQRKLAKAVTFGM